LVTAAWWDDIWLNEGFATWMERKPIEAWHPEWNLEDDATAAAQQIISVDSLSSARAIHGEPRTSSEIKEMFDGITYEKGGAVLRMLEAYLGPEVFRRGVNQYLKEHANGNATSADFWRAMTQVSGKAVDKIMPTFVMQPGVPVVSVRQSCQGGRAQIQLEQQRFEISSTQSATTHEQWQIPVCMKSPQACALVTGKSKQVEGDSCPQWVFANRDAKGYYRLAYSLEDLNKVAAAAEKELTAPERIALVEDTWAMTRAGRYPVAGFMNLAQALRAEQERHVIDLLAAHFEYLGSSLVSEGQETSYNKFVREQFAPLAAKLGWVPRSNDTEDQKTLRASLLQVMGEAGEPGAIAAAHNMVKQYLERPESVEANMTGPAFTVASQTGDAALYDKLHSAFEKTRTQDEYYHYLFALAGFRQPELVERTLQLVAQGKVRQQDYPALFGNLLANPAARSITWKYLKAHWDALAEKVTTFG
ncbi:MAG: M1 family metallopeptidase, partial [Candidatus Angelobacter sp.]